MVKKVNGKDISIIFESISDLVSYIKNTERTSFYKTYHISDDTSLRKINFTGTNSYEEAEDLLLHGWDKKAKELNIKVNDYNVSNTTKNKTVYDVQGFQCSVPRYLQGIPTNMINSKKVSVKQKVLNITKDFGYNWRITIETIEEESIKVLRIVKNLESKGYRVNLYISFVSAYRDKNIDMRVKIKSSSQKLNIKQMAFPLVHPSMFRRIFFALIERLDETKHFGSGYGHCTDYNDVKYLYKGEYYIPRIVEESEIVDIEKYKII